MHKHLQVRYGWKEKQEQLQKIHDILHDDKYKNITGLHKALGDYIDNAHKTSENEDMELKKEESEVAVEKNIFVNRDCDCVWSDWGHWGTCSKTCDEGVKTRNRTVLRPAVNDGKPCKKFVSHTSCFKVHCRKQLKLYSIC